MLSFEQMSPRQAESLWPLLRGVVEEIQARPQPLSWKPRDLIKELSTGVSRLVLAYDNNDCIGYFVFKVGTYQLSGFTAMQIWLAGLFSDKRQGLSKLKLIVTEAMDWLQSQHKMPLEIVTRRRGWERVLKGVLTFRYAVFGRDTI